MSERVAFVAGASGAIGRTVMKLGAPSGLALRPHYRRAPESGAFAGAVIFPLDDQEQLVDALRGVTTIVQLIGTMRKRFAAGDTYESSDIGTTAALLAGARSVGHIDHFVLLSSIGAGRPVGAYLKAKARAESLVTTSGIPYTIVRPSAFDGEGHRAPPGAALLSRIPGLAGFRPIRVEDVARVILRAAQQRAPLGAVLEGATLFQLLDQAR